MRYLAVFGVLTGVGVDMWKNFRSRSKSLKARSRGRVGVWKRWLRSSLVDTPCDSTRPSHDSKIFLFTSWLVWYVM